MNANQLERAAYMAAHAILTANTSAPQLACPGARRSHAVDTIAGIIKGVLQLHCSELDDYTDRWEPAVSIGHRRTLSVSVQPPRSEKILQLRAESAVQIGS